MLLFICTISMLCSIICAALNPYIGIFAILPAVTLIAMLILSTIGIHHLKNSNQPINKPYKCAKRGTTYMRTSYALCAITCGLTSILSIILMIIKLEPQFDILQIQNDTGLCNCFAFMQFFCHFIGLIMIITHHEATIRTMLELTPANLQSKERMSTI